MSYQYAKGNVEKVEKWWTVDRNQEYRLDRGATPLLERCMRVHGFSEHFALRVLQGYRQFMELKEVMRDWDGDKLVAPVAIQQMWEQHLLDIPNYIDDCTMLFGRVLGHNPDAVLFPKLRMDREQSTKIGMQARYGDITDTEVWDYATISDVTQNVMIEEPPRSRSIPGTFARSGRLPVAGVASPIAQQGAPLNYFNSSQQVVAPNLQRGMYSNSQQDPEARRAGRDRASPSPARGRQRMGRSYDDEERSQVGMSGDEEQRRTATTDRGRNLENTTPMRRARSTSKTPQQTKTADAITILLQDSDTGEETYFSLKETSSLRIVFNVFAQRKNEDIETIRFSLKGEALTGYETPYGLGLEDRSRIDYSIIR